MRDFLGKACTADLEVEIVGRRVLCVDETGSTNRDVLRLARQGEPEGTVVVADRQTAGRGRLDRSWESPPGKNLALSVLLRPAIEPDLIPFLAILAGVAACEVLRETTHAFCVLKWPNDVIILDRKACGILAEAEFDERGAAAVALGIGINVNARLEDFSPAVAEVATSLRMAMDEEFDRGVIFRALLQRLDLWYRDLRENGTANLVVRWNELSGVAGHHVVVRTATETIRGKVVKLGREGALVLATREGTRRILAGDVVEVRRQV